MAEQNTPDKIISGRPWKKGDKFKSFIEGEKTLTFPEGKSREKPTWDEIENCKNITKEEVAKEWENFMKDDATQNKRSFVGNPIIYHYFTKELIKTRYKGGATLEEEWAKDSDKMWANVCKIDRRKAFPPSPVDVFEKNRAITFFKPTIAKYIGGEILIHICPPFASLFQFGDIPSYESLEGREGVLWWFPCPDDVSMLWSLGEGRTYVYQYFSSDV